MRDIIKLLHGKSEEEKRKIIDSFTDEEAAEFLEYVETHKDEMGKESDRFTFRRILSTLSTLLTSNQNVITSLEMLKDNSNITVENEVKLAEPAWYGKGLKTLTTGLVEAIKGTSVNIANSEPIPVQLLDKDGKPAEFKPNITVNGGGGAGSLLITEKLDEMVNTTQNLLGFDIPPYDTLDLTYVSAGNGAGEIETVVYKKDSDTVATLTLAYNSSDKLSSVTKS